MSVVAAEDFQTRPNCPSASVLTLQENLAGCMVSRPSRVRCGNCTGTVVLQKTGLVEPQAMHMWYSIWRSYPTMIGQSNAGYWCSSRIPDVTGSQVYALTSQVLHTPRVVMGGNVQFDVGQVSSNAAFPPNAAEIIACGK